MIVISKSSFSLFGIDIPFYGVFFVFGFAVAVLVALFNAKRLNIKKTEVMYAGIFAGVGGLVGAKLLSVLTSIHIIIEYKLSIMQIMQNGFVFYGGLIGGFLGLFIYCKIYKLPLEDYCDMLAPGVAFGHAFGRLGCLFSGCCFGQTVSGGFCVVYTGCANLSTPLNTPLLPVQLIESFCLIVLFALSEFAVIKCRKSGVPALTYLVGYAVARFVIEFFRNDAERGVYWLSTSQYISVAILVCCAVYLIYKYVNKRANNN